MNNYISPPIHQIQMKSCDYGIEPLGSTAFLYSFARDVGVQGVAGRN